MGVHSKTRFFFAGGEGVHENQYIEENGLKRGAWTVCRFKGGLAKKRGVYPNALYEEAFSRELFSRESYIVDVRLGSKYT